MNPAFSIFCEEILQYNNILCAQRLTPNVSRGDAGGCGDPYRCRKVISIDSVKVLDDSVQKEGLQCSRFVISAQQYWGIKTSLRHTAHTELLVEVS